MYLFRRIAWRLQSLSEGDLSARARERAAQLAVHADLRLRPPQGFSEQTDAGTANDPKLGRDPRLPRVGAELTRKHKEMSSRPSARTGL